MRLSPDAPRSVAPGPFPRRFRLCAVLLALVLVGASAPAAWGQTTYYVDGDAGNDGSTGETWASAFATLTKALDAATGSDQIWIAQGTYYPDEGPGVTDDDRSASFTVTGVQDGLEIYGGFENGDAFTDRSPADHPVILSGDVNGDGGAPFNSYHIVLMDGGASIGSDIDANITSATVLSGVTITGGRANGTGFDIEGGGLYCDGSGSGNACSPTLTHVTFIGNQAQYKGGAIYNNGAFSGTSSPTIANAVFSGNESLNTGGAIHNDGTSSPTITNALFAGNTAGISGGAIYNYRDPLGTSRLTLTNATFTGNTASGQGGAMYSVGMDGTNGPAITNTIFYDNAAPSGGDALHNKDVVPTVAHSLIEGGVNGDGVGGNANIDNGNNLDADPRFVDSTDADGPDDTFATADDGFVLTENSPAVDAGDSTALSAPTDITGAVRVQDATVDLGAYEFSASVTYYVDGTGGHDGNDGTSWASAFATLPQALGVAGGGDTIYIAQGTYTPGPDRSDSFTITGNQYRLKIYGGFEAGDAFADRSPADHPTILSGDIGTPGDPSDNSYHVVVVDGGTGIGPDIGANITGATVLSGVTITGGNANGAAPDNRGGGLFCDGEGPGNACSPTLKNITFSDNAAEDGGAIYNNGYDGTSSPTILRAVFADNTAENNGGALYNDGTRSYFPTVSSPTITNALFAGNAAGGNGGALYNDGGLGGTSSPPITNATFAGNTAEEDGGAIYNNGGEAATTITNTVLYGNAATGNGDEIYNDAVSAYLAYSLIDGGVNGDGVAGTINIDIGNNLDADPLFVDPADADGPDDTFATADDGLRLTESSPAVDAGDSGALAEATDLAGADRVRNGTVDLGAYELAPPVTYHVDGSSGHDSNDGTGWASAFATLTQALGVAGGTDQIWVAQGTYTPGPDRSDSFTITGPQDGLRIYGGFEAGDAFADRHPADHPVILSGDIGTPGDPSDNSYHVVIMDAGNRIGPDIGANITGATVLSGVTITGGNANGSPPDIAGGGLFCDGEGPGNACSPTLKNITFSDNAAEEGGAVYNSGFFGGTSSPAILNVVFSGNTATNNGGALYNVSFSEGTSSPTITNVTFVGNTAANNGGAMYNYGAFGGTSIPAVTNTILWGNAATNEGDEVYNLDATATVAYSLIEGGVNGEGVAGEANTDAGNNLVADPLFARPGDPDGPDGTFATADDGLRLTEGSPALNAGDSTALSAPTDITGAVRVQGATVDLGAYEGTDGVIPVELTRLTATPDAGGVLLEWTTAAETQNAGFEVERQSVGEGNTSSNAASGDAASGDAASGDWTTVGFVEGAGTTTEAQAYRFRAEGLPVGTHRFRLRQLDADGTATLSAPVAATVRLAEAYRVTAPAPNPAVSGATMRLAVREAQPVRVAVYDVLGREVRVVFDGPMSAQQPTTLRIGEGLPAGQYFVRAVGERFSATERLTIVR